MELNTLFERAVEIRQVIPTASIKQRLANAAQELSLAGSNQARVELLNESVMALTKVLYDAEPDGALANIDARTHRLLIPAPWGRAGWKRWGLRAWEAEVMRQILIVRGQMERVKPLFDYNEESRTWHLNLGSYPRLDMAMMHWKSNQITLREWRLHADASRQKAHERMNRHRGVE